MSFQAQSWAVRQKTGSASAKLVLLCLANYADVDGKCWPSQAALAADSEQSIDTVQRRLSELVKLGLIYLGPRKQNSGRAGARYCFVLHTPEALAAAAAFGFDAGVLGASDGVSQEVDNAQIPQSAVSEHETWGEAGDASAENYDIEQNQQIKKTDTADCGISENGEQIPQIAVSADTAPVRFLRNSHLGTYHTPYTPKNPDGAAPRSWEVDWDEFEQAWRWSVSDNRASAKAAMRRMDDPKLRAEALRWVADYIRVQDRQKRALGSARDYLARERFVDLAKAGKPAHAMVWVIKGTPAFAAWEAYKRAKGLCGRAGLFATSVRQPDGSFSTGRYEPTLYPPRENQREGPEARAG